MGGVSLHRAGDPHARPAAQIELIVKEYAGRSELAKRLAKSPHAGTVGDIQRCYGDGLDAQSHGESFLKLFLIAPEHYLERL